MVRKSFTFQTTELDHSEPKLLLEVYQSGWILAADKREVSGNSGKIWPISCSNKIELVYNPTCPHMDSAGVNKHKLAIDGSV